MENRKSIFTSAVVSIIIATVSALTVSIYAYLQATNVRQVEAKIVVEKLYMENAKLKDEIKDLINRINNLEKEVNQNRGLVESLNNTVKFQTDVIQSLLNKKEVQK